MGARIEADLHGSGSADLMKVNREGGENGGLPGIEDCSGQLGVPQRSQQAGKVCGEI